MLPSLANAKQKRESLLKQVKTFGKDKMGYVNAQGSLKDLKARTKKIK